MSHRVTQANSAANRSDKTTLVNPLASTSAASSSFLSGQLSQRLLDWYARSGRDLPWRRTRDPYAIWISEIMLQQTQVKTVLPYYDRWLKQFPTVKILAAAGQQTVLKAWEGLGYYARARNLHRAAQMIVERFDGVFPSNFDDAMSLPGIGRTTAGGILSSAFNLPLPIMDGNVKRVLARLIGLDVPPAKALDRLWEISTNLVPPDHGRDFNQAFMDLGATLCTPHNPACLICPWQADCQAYQQNRQAELPISERKKPLPHKSFGLVAMINQQNQALIYQRPEKGLLGGLWDFPNVEVAKGRSVANAIKNSIAVEYAVQFELGEAVMQVDHTYTHFKATYHLYRAQFQQAMDTSDLLPMDAQKKWVGVNDLRQYPFPKSHLKMLDRLAVTELVD